MSQKFVSLEEAAEKLGISKERLNELREAGVLNGYRDGTSWKFRTEVVEKLLAEGVPGTDASAEEADLLSVDADDDAIELGIEPLGDGDDAESILLAEGDIEGGLPRPPSTIIGKGDLSLGDSDLELPSSKPVASFEGLEELELDLEAESSRILQAGEVEAARKAASASPLADDLQIDDDDLELDLGSAAGEASGVDLVVDGSDPALTGGSGATGEIPPLSGTALEGASASRVELGEDEDDDVVLGDSSGDLSLSTSDSGINLRPSDSGIALDEVQLDLGGSAIGSAFDLASLSAGPGSGKQEAAADPFLLTPDTPADSDDEEDSSQVVALEEIGEDAAGPVAFEEDEVGEDLGFSAEPAGLDGGLAAAGVGAPMGAASVHQASFPTWILVLLGCSMLTMSLCGMMAIDLVHSMWSYDEPYSINSSLMDAIGGVFGR